MKKKIVIQEYNKTTEREISYIPFRYIVSIFLVVLETLGVIVVIMVKVFSPLFRLTKCLQIKNVFLTNV